MTSDPLPELPVNELKAIVGPRYVRPAATSDTVCGVAPKMVVEPGNPEELSRVLRCSNSAGIGVVPRGSGTKLEWGNPPRQVDLVLSTLRLNRIEEHAWDDMTATVEAGCTLGEFQRALGEHGQFLALDALWREHSTIGGVLATNDSGACRIRFGGLRDLIIGVTLALPNGTLARSGGKVVKNVAGYDLPKLATGSLGTLGVITRAVFRLHPRPQVSKTIGFAFEDSAAVSRLVLAILDSQLEYTGLQIRAKARAPFRLDVRLAGTSTGVDAQAQRLTSFAPKAGKLETAPEVWDEREALWIGNEPSLVCKFSVLPSRLGACCDSVSRVAEQLQLNHGLVAQGTGLGLIRVEAGSGAGCLAAATDLRREMTLLGGTLVVLHSPPELRGRIDTWGPAGDSQPLMRRIKDQFDPAGIMNPGRFVGGL